MKAITALIWHLLAILLFLGLYLVACQVWPGLSAHQSFTLWTVATFAGLSLLITVLSARLANHHNPYYFSWVTMLSVLVKLGAGIAIIVYYTRKYAPTDQLYVISFILAYVLFTVCEVWILQIIIKHAKKSWKR